VPRWDCQSRRPGSHLTKGESVTHPPSAI
jgi:hypothetical protein